MNLRLAKALSCFLLSIVLISPRFTSAQTTVNFNVDVTASNYKVIKTVALPGNKLAILAVTPNYSNAYLWVYDQSGTRTTNSNITSLIAWPNLFKPATEFNAIVTNNGNIFITYNSSDADDVVSDEIKFMILAESGALQYSGVINTTNPGSSLNRFVQLAKLSDGNIVAAFHRSDNASHAFRIFSEDGTAITANDIVYAGPGTDNESTSGYDEVRDSRIGVFKNGNFMISFSFFDAPLTAVLFDNSGNTIPVGGMGNFEPAEATDEYNNYANVTLANGNVVAFWRYYSDSYFKIISSSGATIQATQVIDGGDRLGNFIPDNTPGAEGFIVTESTYQGDPWEDPNILYAIKKYDQTGEFQSSSSPQGYLILPSYYLTSGSSGGFAYVYSHYKTYNVADGEYNITSDNDLKGVMTAFSMSTLPVNLISYTVKLLSDQKAQLNWSTASETNSKNFVIEKSIDGRNFVSIGSVDAAGNSATTLSYSFTDPVVIKQKSWYRLKQFDMDDKQKDLGIKFVNPGKAGLPPNVYPNPVVGNVINIHAGDERLPATYRLSDVQGRPVKTGTLRQQQQQISVQDLPDGIYFLRIGDTRVIKIKK